MTVVKDDYDTPWKDILEAYFPQFLMFFFPLVYANIDWSKGYRFLDKELQKIIRDAKTGRRYADKLVEVSSLEGKKVAIIIHIEIQGDRESAFPERMYIYNYRFYDRYRLPVVSLALLTDDDPSWRPGKFGYEKWGCEVELKFPIVKMLDYTDDLPGLEAETNPFAIIVLAHLGTQKTKQDPENRYNWKWKIIRLLYERGYSRQDIKNIFAFIDWIMTLPKELAERFNQELVTYEKEKNMPYVTTIERFAMEKGEQKGVEKGIQKGKVENAQDMILDALEAKFGSISKEIKENILLLDDQTKLKKLHQEAILSQDLNEFSEKFHLLISNSE